MANILHSLLGSSSGRSVVLAGGVRHPLAQRFVAGDQLSDALQAAKPWREAGCELALQPLVSAEPAHAAGVEAAVEQYFEALRAIDTFFPGTHLIVEPGALGLGIDRDLARRSLNRVLERGRERNGVFVQLGMGPSATVPDTLELAAAGRAEYGLGVGVTLQAQLRRTAADLSALANEGAPVRLVRGRYAESPRDAYRDEAEARSQLRKRMLELLDAREQFHPIIAISDAALLADLRRYAKQHAIAKEAFDCELPMGVARDTVSALLNDGRQVRITIPYGEEWQPYLTQRVEKERGGVGLLIGAAFKR